MLRGIRKPKERLTAAFDHSLTSAIAHGQAFSVYSARFVPNFIFLDTALRLSKMGDLISSIAWYASCYTVVCSTDPH